MATNCVDREVLLTADKAFDYESVDEISFAVTVTDQGGLSASTYVILTINDVNEKPYFTDTNETFYVEVGSHLDSLVIQCE